MRIWWLVAAACCTLAKRWLARTINHFGQWPTMSQPCRTSSWAHFYAILMTFSSGTGFPRVSLPPLPLERRLPLWCICSLCSLCSLCLSPESASIMNEWMSEWVSEWMNVEWAGWNLKWWGKRRWTVNVKISAVSAPISFYLSMVCGIAFMPFVRIWELYRLILFDGKKCEDHLALSSIIFKVNIS